MDMVRPWVLDVQGATGSVPLPMNLEFPSGVLSKTQILDSSKFFPSQASHPELPPHLLTRRGTKCPPALQILDNHLENLGDIQHLPNGLMAENSSPPKRLTSTKQNYEGPMHLAFGTRFPLPSPTTGFGAVKRR